MKDGIIMLKSLIIIPAYNEEKSILDTVTDIQKYAPEFDYIVINDCSGDKTLDGGILAQVDHSHGTASQFLEHLVAS